MGRGHGQVHCPKPQSWTKQKKKKREDSHTSVFVRWGKVILLGLFFPSPIICVSWVMPMSQFIPEELFINLITEKRRIWKGKTSDTKSEHTICREIAFSICNWQGWKWSKWFWVRGGITWSPATQLQVDPEVIDRHQVAPQQLVQCAVEFSNSFQDLWFSGILLQCTFFCLCLGLPCWTTRGIALVRFFFKPQLCFPSKFDSDLGWSKLKKVMLMLTWIQ